MTPQKMIKAFSETLSESIDGFLWLERSYIKKLVTQEDLKNSPLFKKALHIKSMTDEEYGYYYHLYLDIVCQKIVDLEHNEKVKLIIALSEREKDYTIYNNMVKKINQSILETQKTYNFKELTKQIKTISKTTHEYKLKPEQIEKIIIDYLSSVSSVYHSFVSLETNEVFSNYCNNI